MKEEKRHEAKDEVKGREAEIKAQKDQTEKDPAMKLNSDKYIHTYIHT